MHRDTTEDPKELQRRVELLGQALGEVLVAAGMIRPGVPMSGPELLHAASDFCEAQNFERQRFVAAFTALKHPDRVLVGEPVPREDGRFYVPVMRRVPARRLSDTVFRVASDAFHSIEAAEVFANVLANAYNNQPGAHKGD